MFNQKYHWIYILKWLIFQEDKLKFCSNLFYSKCICSRTLILYISKLKLQINKLKYVI